MTKYRVSIMFNRGYGFDMLSDNILKVYKVAHDISRGTEAPTENEQWLNGIKNFEELKEEDCAPEIAVFVYPEED